MTQAPVSVIVASQNARASIVECLNEVLSQVRDYDAEVLVADASTDGTDKLIAENFPNIRVLRGQSSDLIPHLWGLGMRNAMAPVVAITNAQCIPESGWLSRIMSTFESESVCAVGGPILPPVTSSALDWAIYFSRFTAFMPPVATGEIGELPGDNVAYTKASLDQFWKNPQNGFWETLYHHELRQHQQRLFMSPEVKVHLAHTADASDFFSVRMRHGRHYGSTRPNTSFPARIVRILSAPILVPYLVGRMGVRVLKKRKDFLPFYLLALPWLTVFTVAWAVGEIQGYLYPAHQNG